MTNLITRLTELIIQDNIVLFIGNNLHNQDDGQAHGVVQPEMQAIAETLAKKLLSKQIAFDQMILYSSYASS